MFSTSFIVKRCDIDYPPQPVCSFTCTAAVHWTESTTAPLAQWKMWVRYQQTSLAGNKVPSLNRTEEIWVIWAKERSRTEGEHKCFWHFDLPGCRAQRLINDAVCAEPGFQSHLCYTCETLWECVVKCCCVCVCVCVCRRWRISCPARLLWLRQRRRTDRWVCTSKHTTSTWTL